MSGDAEVIQTVLAWIGGASVGVAAIVTAVYFAFKHLAAKWLDSKFDTRLQQLKHEQEKSLAQYRHEIDKMFDRATKLNQREFEILPVAWAKLNDAFHSTRQAVADLRAYPDVGIMNQAQLDEFFAKQDWPDADKQEVRQQNAANRQIVLERLWDRHGLLASQRKDREAYRFTLEQGIFMSDTIEKKFSMIHDMIWHALIEHDLNLRPANAGPHRQQLRQHISALNLEGETAMKELKQLIHDRLWQDHNRVE